MEGQGLDFAAGAHRRAETERLSSRPGSVRIFPTRSAISSTRSRSAAGEARNTKPMRKRAYSTTRCVSGDSSAMFATRASPRPRRNELTAINQTATIRLGADP